MNKTTLFTFLFLLTCIYPVLAGDTKTFSLKDGSTINGRVLGIENGRYVVDSPTAGEVKLKTSDIVSIVDPNEAPSTPSASTTPNQPNVNAAQGSNPFAAQTQAMRSKMMSDPALMAEIQGLMQDPNIIAALSDPQFVQAVQSGNLQAVQSSPQLQRLMNDPKMKAVVQKVRPQNQ